MIQNRHIVLGAFLFTLIFGLSLLFTWVEPQVQLWLHQNIVKESTRHPQTPFIISPQEIELDLFPPAIHLKKIKLTPKASIQPYLTPVLIERGSLRFSILALLQGQVTVKKVEIHSVDLTTSIKKKAPTKSFKKLDLLQALQQIPVPEISVYNANVSAILPFQEHLLGAKKLFLNIEKTLSNDIRIHASASDFRWKFQPHSPLLKFGAQIKLKLNPNKITVSLLKLNHGDSYITGFGEFHGDWENLTYKKMNANIQSQLLLKDSHFFFNKYFPEMYLPKISGVAEIDMKVRQLYGKRPQINFISKAKNLNINSMQVGVVNAQGIYKGAENGKLTFSTLSMNGPSGYLNLKNTTAHLIDKNRVDVSFEGHTPGINLGKMASSYLQWSQQSPVKLTLSAQFPCQGQLRPQLNLSCKSKFKVTDLAVPNSITGHQTIDQLLQIHAINGETKAQLTNHDISYETQLKLNESSGYSKGRVTYEGDIQSSYSGFIKELSEIFKDYPVTGSLKIKGSMNRKVKSNSLSFNTELGATEFSFNQWHVGNLNTNFVYDKSQIEGRFDGVYKKTSYIGQAKVNLENSNLSMKIKLPNFIISDLRSMSKQQWEGNHTLSTLAGRGSGEMTLDGSINLKPRSEKDNPIKWSQQNVIAKINLMDGAYLGESFEEAKLHVKLDKGWLTTQTLEFKKSGGILKADLKISPQRKIKLNFRGSGFLTEEIDFLRVRGVKLKSEAQFEGSAKGSWEKPEFQLKGLFSKLLNEEGHEAQFQIQANPQLTKGSFNYNQNTLVGQFSYPLESFGNVKLDLTARKWNFGRFFEELFVDSRQVDFNSILDMQAKLQWPLHEYTKVTGLVHLNALNIKKGRQFLQLADKGSLRFKEGFFSMPILHWKGLGKTKLKIQSSRSRLDALNVRIKGSHIPLSLFNLFFPATEGLTGEITTNTYVSGSINNPIWKGESKLRNGYLKLLEFEYPFSQINGSATYNQQKLTIQNLKGLFEGGGWKASGYYSLAKKDRGRADITVNWAGGEFEFPEGVRTGGIANARLQGTHNNYVVRGRYNIKSGEVNIDSQQQENLQNVRLSPYLPDVHQVKNQSPIKLNLLVVLDELLPVEYSTPNLDLTRMSIGGQIRLHGPAEDPLLKGSLFNKGEGRMAFHENEFAIKNSSLVYKDVPADEPDIYITSELQTEEHIITLSAQGPLRDPQLELSSQPYLNQRDLISLLVLGTEPTNLLTTEQNEESTDLGLKLGTLYLQERLGLSGISTNVGLSLAPSDTSTQPGGLVPTLEVQKTWRPQFGEFKTKLDVQAQRTIEENAKTQFHVEYKVNKNLSAIGSYETREQDTALGSSDSNIIGLDIEYNFNFE